MQKILDVVQLQGSTPLVNPSSIAVFQNAASPAAGFQLSPSLRVGMSSNFISNPIAQNSAYVNATPVAYLIRLAGVANFTASSTLTIGLTYGTGTGTVLLAGTASGALAAVNNFFIEYEAQYDPLSLVLNVVLVSGQVGGTVQVQAAGSQTAVATANSIAFGAVATAGTSHAANTVALSEFSLNLL
jgi:hypothetical protein